MKNKEKTYTEQPPTYGPKDPPTDITHARTGTLSLIVGSSFSFSNSLSGSVSVSVSASDSVTTALAMPLDAGRPDREAFVLDVFASAPTELALFTVDGVAGLALNFDVAVVATRL